MSQLKKPIIAFQASAFIGGRIVWVDDRAILGKWSIFYFYPGSRGPYCATELSQIADLYPRLRALDVEAFAVSTDEHTQHARWYRLRGCGRMDGVHMVSDPNGHLCRAFDMFDDHCSRAERGTFIVDPDGIIQSIELAADGIAIAATDLLRKVRAAQMAKVDSSCRCPARDLLDAGYRGTRGGAG